MGISRQELYAALGIKTPSIIETMLTDAYAREAQREWRRENGYQQTSFFISSFPGDDPLACGRAAIYALMGIPQGEPFDVTGQRWMSAGKALEMEFIAKLAAEGMLLSGNESIGEMQTKITDPEVWASGAVDAIVLPPFARKSLVVECKQTSREKIIAMRNDKSSTPFSHDKYVRQIKTY